MHLPHLQERYTLKSSMRNQVNIQGIYSDKRFDALVKQEKIEHEHLISSHNKEMQILRDALSLAMEKFNSLFQRHEEDLKEFKANSTYHVDLLEKRILANEAIISDQKRTIQDLHQQLMDFQDLHSSKNDVDNLKKDLGLQIISNTFSHTNSFQELQASFKVLFNSITDDVNKLKSDMEKKFAEMIQRVDVNFSIVRIDKEGVLKELHRYENDVFVIEKKIENVYTLIDRINKRGVPCPKPE